MADTGKREREKERRRGEKERKKEGDKFVTDEDEKRKSSRSLSPIRFSSITCSPMVCMSE